MNKAIVDIAFDEMMNLARDYDAVHSANIREIVKGEILKAAYKLVESAKITPVTYDVPDFSEVDE